MVTNSVKTLGLPTVLSGCFFKNERLPEANLLYSPRDKIIGTNLIVFGLTQSGLVSTTDHNTTGSVLHIWVI
jgi:hypothetical protein